MERAIYSHGFRHSTQTFTGYVVTADDQPVKENVVEVEYLILLLKVPLLWNI